jgi:phosphatidylserine/phosphatidylglycerophosphate/cardiolipin synthase-like enzyme
MVRGLPSRRLARIVFGLLLLTLLLIVQGCTPPTVQRKTDRAAEPVPVQLSPGDAQLAQSFPIGTDLKDPSLPTTQEVWLQQIRGAQRSIDWAGFYIASARGEALDPVLVELSQAAARGVRLRFIFDKQMAGNDPQALGFLARIPNAAVRILDFNLIATGSHHAKYLVVDNREIFLGSQNFDWRSLSHIQELGVRIAHPHIAGQLAFLFEMDFALAQDRNDTLESNPPVMPRGPTTEIEIGVSPPQLSPDGIRPALPVLLDMIRAAKSRLCIQLLRYSAHQGSERWDTLEEALKQAAARGVRVQLLVSSWSTGTPEIDDLKELAGFPNIEVRIASIPEVPGRFIPYARVIHSKFAVSDEQVLWLGTTNWERTMFMNSRNVDVVLRREVLAKQAQRVFLRTWNSSYSAPVDVRKQYAPPRVK